MDQPRLRALMKIIEEGPAINLFSAGLSPKYLLMAGDKVLAGCLVNAGS